MAKTLKYPLDLDGNTREYKHFIKFTTLAERLTTGTSAIKGNCLLYLPPDALKTSYSQSFADTDLGQAGNTLRNTVQTQTLQQLVNSGGDTGSILNTLRGVGAGAVKDVVKSIGASAIKEAAGAAGAGVTAAITNRVGAVINNHKALIYQGPGGFRTFTYNFSMIPENQNEATMIKDIVRFFKVAMHPDTGSIVKQLNPSERPDDGFTYGFQSQAINSSQLFTYPDEFNISMHSNGSTNNNLFKIDKCFLESFSVDYSTQGATAFFDSGDPVTTTINMQFKETTIMTRRKVRDEGY